MLRPAPERAERHLTMRRNTDDTPRQTGGQQSGGQPSRQPPGQQGQPPGQSPPPQQPPQQGPPQQGPPQQGPPQQSQQVSPRQPPVQSSQMGQPQQTGAQQGQQPQQTRQAQLPQQTQQFQGGQQSRQPQHGQRMTGGGVQPGPTQQGQQAGMRSQQPAQPGVTSPHLQTVTIEDIVQTDVVTAEPDTPIPTVAAMMAEEDVGAVVVVEDDEPEGVITDRKVALALEDTPDLSEETAEDLMSDEIITGSNVMTVFEVIEKLSDEDIRRLPIVDEDGRLVGIVTLDDILVLLDSEMDKATDIIQTQSPRL